ncbi:uncharacterized protein LOC116170960 [Photinus pyralis]|nr:uncharacterized protein LOC116170960 [Photinus pyralis]
MALDRGDSEYSLQYFEFSPETFFREFSELVMEEMSTLVQTCITECASSTCPLENKERVSENVVNMHKDWCDSAAGVLQKVEPLIKSYFTIPKNVLFASDRMCRRVYTEEEVKALEVEVAHLEKVYADECRELASREMCLKKARECESFPKLVESATAKIGPILNTIADIHSLDNLLDTYRKAREKFLDNEVEEEGDISFSKLEQLHHCSGE